MYSVLPGSFTCLAQPWKPCFIWPLQTTPTPWPLKSCASLPTQQEGARPTALITSCRGEISRVFLVYCKHLKGVDLAGHSIKCFLGALGNPGPGHWTGGKKSDNRHSFHVENLGGSECSRFSEATPSAVLVGAGMSNGC